MKPSTIARLVCVLTLSLAPFASAQFLLSPQPGEVYKEYTRIDTPISDSTWRVTDPNATFNSNPPGNNPADYLPNDTLSMSGIDLVGAVRAELVLDAWGGHPGTTNKAIRFTSGANQNFITIPELTTTPTSGQCYMQQTNVSLAIPLNALVSGTNSFEFTAGGQTCYNFNWGQWGHYGLLLRVYYDPNTKAHATGSITSPTTGSSFGENPTISASTSGSVANVDFFAYYDGFDEDGDGRYLDYHHSYHVVASDDSLTLRNHAGSDASAPYSVIWNTVWVPDQTAGVVKILARIKDNNGVYFVTDEVINLSFARVGTSVKLYKSQNTPEIFWVRNGGISGASTKSSTYTIPESDNLVIATAAQLYISTWNGIDGQSEGATHFMKVNNYTFPNFGQDHFPSYDYLNVPTTNLNNGTNTFFVNSFSDHHGIEVMWPGPSLAVRYGNITGPTFTQHPSNQNVGSGSTATFTVAAVGTGTITYQWQKNNGDISGATDASYTTPPLTGGDNGATFRCIAGDATGSTTSNSATLTVTIGTVGGPWWDTQWHYRTQVAANAGGYQRTSKVANFAINFTPILTNLGASGSFNTQSVRVVEVDAGGTVIDQNVVYQFDPDATFNAATNALGTVVVLLNGTTSANTTRYFHIYFDTVAGFTLPTFTSQVTLTDNVSAQGQLSYQITNQLGNLYYHKQGGAFSSMRDLSSTEWIGYDPTPGSHGAGEYRGLPNMGDYAHPGYTSGSSTILSQGPIKVTVQTVTNAPTNARWIWEFYPTFQTMTLQQTGVPYWLLYEGTPNGSLDQVNGFIKTSDGQTRTLGQNFATDIPNPEWAYFGQTGQQRTMFFVHHNDDNIVDHYRPFVDVGAMTVFGFGRDAANSVEHKLTAVPAKISFGMSEVENQTTGTIDNAFRDLTQAIGISEANISGPATITQQPASQTVDIGETATFTVGAVGTSPLGYQWQRNNGDIPGATSSSYTTPATDFADDGATFRCIVSNGLGTATSNAAILNVNPPPPAPASFISSDEFNSTQLNLLLWRFANPVGDASRGMTGTQLSISVPSGTPHDVYTNANDAPRVLQNIVDIQEFGVEAKFDTPIGSQYQIHGIMVEQDATNLLRFDFYTDGTNTFVTSISLANNIATSHVNTSIGGINLSPLYIRVFRNATNWILRYSTDGNTWTDAVTFDYALAVSSIGVFAGNAGPSPALTGLVDYFWNLADVPVQLASFTASHISTHQIRLDWTTVSETNNYGFEVQKSFGGSTNYQTIEGSFIAGHGTTLEPHSYSFIDGITSNGLWFYRLKQIDLDGTAHTTEPIQVNTLTSVSDQKVPTEFALSQNYPNPFNPTTRIEYALPKETNVRIEIFNTVGQSVRLVVNARQSIGYHGVEFDASGLGSGIYFYTLKTNEASFTKKMMLLR